MAAEVAGVGIGWRPEISRFVLGLPGLRFCEVIAEAVDPAAPVPALLELRERGVAVIPHGVKLSLGSAEPVSAQRVERLAAVARALDAPLVSEHVAFVRAGGQEAGHLLPVPRTAAALDALEANITRTMEALDGIPFAVEHIASFVEWPDAEFEEGEFLRELLDRTGALLLLDVANVYANAVNRGQDPAEQLDRLPLDRIAYVHVAGGAEADGLYHDTHTERTPEPVLELVRRLASTDDAPAFMLERDGRYPSAPELRDELDAIARAADLPPVTL